MVVPVKVSATENGTRLYRFLARHYPCVNMILIRRLCRSGEIRINSKRCKEIEILKTGDLIRIPPVVANHTSATKTKDVVKDDFSFADLEKLRQCIIHNDDDIVAFNKPAGLATQGGNNVKKSLDKMAAALFPNDMARLVHRLDKETSGIILVAKNQIAAQRLSTAFQSKDIQKIYLALLSGGVSPKKGLINSPIGGKKAVTKYQVLGELKNALSFVRFAPETGKKHQLRIHSASALNAPIVGDTLYGGREFDAKLKTLISTNHLYLFASRVTFRHPRTGKQLTLNATMPEWMASVANLMEVEL